MIEGVKNFYTFKKFYTFGGVEWILLGRVGVLFDIFLKNDDIPVVNRQSLTIRLYVEELVSAWGRAETWAALTFSFLR